MELKRNISKQRTERAHANSKEGNEGWNTERVRGACVHACVEGWSSSSHFYSEVLKTLQPQYFQSQTHHVYQRVSHLVPLEYFLAWWSKSPFIIIQGGCLVLILSIILTCDQNSSPFHSVSPHKPSPLSSVLLLYRVLLPNILLGLGGPTLLTHSSLFSHNLFRTIFQKYINLTISPTHKNSAMTFPLLFN